jgi:hypothetical protein
MPVAFQETLNNHTLTAEELLAGGSLTFPVEIPAEYLSGGGDGEPAERPGRVVLRPLTVKDVQRIVKATREEAGLSSAVMIQQALVEPSLTIAQVAALPAGLARFLVNEINRISGLSTSGDELVEYVQSPLARACFILSREFGWTPEEISGLTIGQILLYLQMARPGSG